MSKGYTRAVAILLIPFLIADPATASALSHSPISAVHDISSSQTKFQDQALAIPALSALSSLLTKIHRSWVEMLTVQSSAAPISICYWLIKARHPEISEEDAIKSGRKGLRWEIPSLILLSISIVYFPTLIILLAGFYARHLRLQYMASHRPQAPPFSIWGAGIQLIFFSCYLLPTLFHSLAAPLSPMLSLYAAFFHWQHDQAMFSRILMEADLQEAVITIKNLEKTISEWKEKAARDPLTGLYNRRMFDERLRESIKRAEEGQSFSLYILDIDNFKMINDQFGHPIGDLVLLYTTGRLLNTDLPIVVGRSDHTAGESGRRTSSNSVAARWGGEEFVRLLDGADQEEAIDVANQERELLMCPIREIIGAEAFEALKKVNPEIENLIVTASYGIATYRPGDDAEKLLKRADDNLLKAKQTGKNNVVADPAESQGAQPKKVELPPEDKLNIAAEGPVAPWHELAARAKNEFERNGQISELPQDEKAKVVELLRRYGHDMLAERLRRTKVNLYGTKETEFLVEHIDDKGKHWHLTTEGDLENEEINMAMGEKIRLINRGKNKGDEYRCFGGRLAHELIEFETWEERMHQLGLTFNTLPDWCLKNKDVKEKYEKVTHGLGLRIEREFSKDLDIQPDYAVSDPTYVVISNGLENLPPSPDRSHLVAFAEAIMRNGRRSIRNLYEAWEVTDSVLFGNRENEGLQHQVDKPHWFDRTPLQEVMWIEDQMAEVRNIRHEILRKAFHKSLDQLPPLLKGPIRWPKGTIIYPLGTQNPDGIFQVMLKTENPLVIITGSDWFFLEQDIQGNWVLRHRESHAAFRIPRGEVFEIGRDKKFSRVNRKAQLDESVSSRQADICIYPEGEIVIRDVNSREGTIVALLPTFRARSHERLVLDNIRIIEHLIQEDIIRWTLGGPLYFYVDPDGRILNTLTSKMSELAKDHLILKVVKSENSRVRIDKVWRTIWVGIKLMREQLFFPEDLRWSWLSRNIYKAIHGYEMKYGLGEFLTSSRNQSSLAPLHRQA
jgi:GGDEF domain-containing protein